jgi:hypothetical protein
MITSTMAETYEIKDFQPKPEAPGLKEETILQIELKCLVG